MQFIIESPGLQTGDQVRQFIQAKFQNLARMDSRIRKCLVILKKENDHHKKDFHLEAQITIPRKTLFAHERAETFESALLYVINDLAHQLRRYKPEREEIW